MKTDQYGQMIWNETDVCDLVMQGKNIKDLSHMILEPGVDLRNIRAVLEDADDLLSWQNRDSGDVSVAEFDRQQQSHWHMPDDYKNLDIAAHVLGLCESDAELQRCGEELLLFQQAGLFDLLRYLCYLVDTMQCHDVIWGVGRGSSVASFVLYKLKVHRINSLYYDLDPREFLR
jgi:hypothetical protein